MRADLYKEMFQMEEMYWWHVAKRLMVKSLLSQNLKGSTEAKRFVDVGCGTGKFLEEIKKWKSWKYLLGLDGSDEALAFTKQRGLVSIKKADFERMLPLKTNSVDIITSLDVVEHVENHTELVDEFFRVLKPGGLAVITVPAHKWLWTYWDEMLGHKRRYTKVEVEQLLTASGFKVRKVSYFYSYLLPVVIIVRFIKSLQKSQKPSSDFVSVPDWLNQFLIILARIETHLIRFTNLPLGLSVVCVGEKN